MSNSRHQVLLLFAMKTDVLETDLQRSLCNQTSTLKKKHLVQVLKLCQRNGEKNGLSDKA